MKTRKDWHESGLDFSRFAKPGDKVAEEIVEYFLGCVPPETHTANLIQCGEPSSDAWCSYRRATLPTYSTFIRTGVINDEGQWVYLGDRFSKEYLRVSSRKLPELNENEMEHFFNSNDEEIYMVCFAGTEHQKTQCFIPPRKWDDSFKEAYEKFNI